MKGRVFVDDIMPVAVMPVAVMPVAVMPAAVRASDTCSESLVDKESLADKASLANQLCLTRGTSPCQSRQTR